MIVVLGCGVSGLTCAAALQEAGHRVVIWTRMRPPQTTSNVAAAFWYPYRAFPFDRVARWSARSYERFATLSADPSTGVTMVRAYDLSRNILPRPWWADAVPTLRQATAEELPEGLGFGWVFDAPVVDTRRYLPWLLETVQARGAQIVQREVRDLAEALQAADVVVNCTGLGARELCHDEQLVPVRGQLVHVANPGLKHVVLDEQDGDGIAYVVPRGDDVVLGGTASEHDEDLATREDETDSILRRTAALVPALTHATRLAEVVGVRPGRHAVRLQAESIGGGKRVVHDYGHGGAGITLSWGCALEVVELVEDVPGDAEARARS